MKIVEQSFKILPEISDPIKQIASLARICYKSEDKAQEDERGFLTRIKDHEPVFEMAVVSLLLEYDTGMANKLHASKYIHVSGLETSDHILATGSIRAWREFIITNDRVYTRAVDQTLSKYNDFLFGDATNKNDFNEEVKVIDPTTLGLSPEELKKHIHVAVKFITNRAVSHELVRHRPCAFLQESQRYCRYDQEKFGGEVTFIDPRPAFDFFRDDSNFSEWKVTCWETENNYIQFLKDGASPQAARTVLPNSCKTEIIVYCNLKEWEHIFNRRVSPAAEPSMREQIIPLHAEFNHRFEGMFEDPQLSVG